MESLQSSSSIKNTNNSKDILHQIRVHLKDDQVYYIGSDDEHLSEYVADYDKRREFVSKFDGSRGILLITKAKAYIFVDGRYTLQVKKQVDSSIWTIKSLKGFYTFLKSPRLKGFTFLYDPHLIPCTKEYNISEILPVQANSTCIVDAVWNQKQYNRPPMKFNPILVHPLIYSGVSTQEKYSSLKEAYKRLDSDIDGIFISSLDLLCWMLNIRSSDVDYCPVVRGYLLIDFRESSEFSFHLLADDDSVQKTNNDSTQSKRIPLATKKYFNSIKCKVWPYKCKNIFNNIEKFNCIGYDPSASSMYWKHCIQENCDFSFELENDHPLAKAMAKKNSTELDGFRDCQKRDGIALCKLFLWLEKYLLPTVDPLAPFPSNLPISDHKYWPITEYTISEKIKSLRSEQNLFQEPSFPTICGYGPNGAIIHYSPTSTDFAHCARDNLILLDSGGQYLDGTTDTTRTVHFGTPSPQQKFHFTLVLLGHLRFATAVFPERHHDTILDYLSRSALYEHGLDFPHGVGHGVGSYLNVHEGPHLISGMNKSCIEIDWTTSDEPGYYLENKYGIRIESVLACRPYKINTEIQPGMACFENLTCVPIQTKLVDSSLMSRKELAWLNDYNQWVFDNLLPLSKGDPELVEFLKRECAPLDF